VSFGMVMLAFAAGCYPDDGEATEPPVGSAESAIYNGTGDGHEAVVFVETNFGPCSGTVVKVKGTCGYVLTAAHCCQSIEGHLKPLSISFGADASHPTSHKPVIEGSVRTDPAYTPGHEPDPFHPRPPHGWRHDFCVFQFKADPGTPSISPLPLAEDTLSDPDPLDIVGYGRTGSVPTPPSYWPTDNSIPGDPNSKRLHKRVPIYLPLGSELLTFDETAAGGGPGPGDSGGPALSDAIKVAGVTSTAYFFADPTSSLYRHLMAVSARVSSAYDPDQKTGFIYDALQDACLDGSSTGEPHIVTHDGLMYDLNVTGDFILVSTTTGFAVQARQAEVPGRPGLTWNTAIAVRLGADRLNVVADPLRVTIDGVPTPLEDGVPLRLSSGDTLTQSGLSLLVRRTTGDRAQITTFEGYPLLNVEVGVTSGPSEGILGDADGDPTNDLVIRNGSVLSYPPEYAELYGPFAQSWLVPPGESLLGAGPALHA
jgi:hypothetical protein